MLGSNRDRPAAMLKTTYCTAFLHGSNNPNDVGHLEHGEWMDFTKTQQWKDAEDSLRSSNYSSEQREIFSYNRTVAVRFSSTTLNFLSCPGSCKFVNLLLILIYNQ
jgi:hypothetical protein